MEHTIRWIDIGNIGVVCREPRPERYSRRTAKSHSTVMALEAGALIGQVLLYKWHIRQRVHMKVLIVRQDEHHVRLLAALQGLLWYICIRPYR